MGKLNPMVMAGAEPEFYMGTSGVGCVITHGFMASPNEVIWWGRYLAQQGHSVYMPRLTAHGTDPLAMDRARWEDWLGDVINGYHLLRPYCDKMVLGGLSMGGLLSLLTASHLPVAGVMAAAAPVRLQGFQIWLLPVLRFLMPYSDHPNIDDLADRVLAEQIDNGEPPVGRVRYKIWSNKAVLELLVAMNELQKRLPLITAPLFLAYSSHDPAVPLDNMTLIETRAVCAASIESHIFDNSGHILTQDRDKEEMFARSEKFIQQVVMP